MTASLFDEPIEAAPSLFKDSPAAPEPFTVKRCGASFNVLDGSGMLVRAFPNGREQAARDYSADLNAAFASGWASRDRVK